MKSHLYFAENRRESGVDFMIYKHTQIVFLLTAPGSEV